MTTAQERIEDYMTGYARGNKAGLRYLASFDGWAQAARDELNRRAQSFISLMTEEELAAIANGEININAAAKAVLEPNS